MIDCDVHPRLPTIDELVAHLPEFWGDYVREFGFAGHGGVSLYAPPRSPVGRVATFAELQAQLDATGTAFAILNCVYGLEAFQNVDFAHALATAVNDWIASDWLDRDARLRASIVVKPDDPVGAAAEIGRRASDPRFVQVLLPARAGERPYGNRFYLPLLEAAAQAQLPVAIHAGADTGAANTAVGWTAHLLEDVVMMPQVFQSQLTSLIAEGTFGRLPGLRIVLLESGWTWLPSLFWRLEKDWKGLTREVPWVQQSPAATLRERVRVTLQPIDAPAQPQQLVDLLEQIGCDELLLHSSDFPRPHVTTVDQAFGELLPAGLVDRWTDTNPRLVYALDG
jgi:predicted TIM-barrel fold metal-dependent hydrolase